VPSGRLTAARPEIAEIGRFSTLSMAVCFQFPAIALPETTIAILCER
jgi:hypothetical protein